ncbi:MAG: hypothetical protein WC683_07690 [bacterium]
MTVRSVTGEVVRLRRSREHYLDDLALYAFSEARRQARRAREAEEQLRIAMAFVPKIDDDDECTL